MYKHKMIKYDRILIRNSARNFIFCAHLAYNTIIDREKNMQICINPNHNYYYTHETSIYYINVAS